MNEKENLLTYEQEQENQKQLEKADYYSYKESLRDSDGWESIFINTISHLDLVNHLNDTKFENQDYLNTLKLYKVYYKDDDWKGVIASTKLCAENIFRSWNSNYSVSHIIECEFKDIDKKRIMYWAKQWRLQTNAILKDNIMRNIEKGSLEEIK